MKTETGFVELMQGIRQSAGRLGLGALVVLGCLGATPTAAKANISWTFNNVDFYVQTWTASAGPNGGFVPHEVADLSGSFTTDDSVTTVIASDLTVTGLPGYSEYGFDVAGMVDDYLPRTIGIYAAGWSSYIDLYLTSPLTAASGPHSISSGYDCPGCAVLDPNDHASVGVGAQISTTSISVAPEPGFYAVLALGLSGLLFAGWRRGRA